MPPPYLHNILTHVVMHGGIVCAQKNCDFDSGARTHARTHSFCTHARRHARTVCAQQFFLRTHAIKHKTYAHTLTKKCTRTHARTHASMRPLQLSKMQKKRVSEEIGPREEKDRATPTQHRPALPPSIDLPEGLAERSKASP